MSTATTTRRIPKTQCAGCGLYFTSTGEFDSHRTGGYGLPTGHPKGRRCLTTAELAAAGWVVEIMLVRIGDTREPREVWRRATMPRAAAPAAKSDAIAAGAGAGAPPPVAGSSPHLASSGVRRHGCQYG